MRRFALVRCNMISTIGLCVVLAGLAIQCAAARGAEYKPGVEWAEPKIIDPGPVGGPPSDAVVLFDGKDMSAFEGGEKWIVENGVATGDKASIRTKQSFGDVQLHLEWAAPEKVEGSGQGRGNSGVLFFNRYEVQILDSYDNVTYYDGQAAAIYKQHPPLVNACRKPGEWQTYDIIFTAPRFDLQGRLMAPAYATVLHNGVLVQDHFKLAGDTPFNRPPSYTAHPAKGPVELQFHHNPVRFRNIWIREIQEIKGKRVAQPMVDEPPRKEGARQEAAPKGPGQKKAKKGAAAEPSAPEPPKQAQP